MALLYSLTSRLNYIVYNTMCILAVCGLLSHLQVRFGHFIGLRDGPLGVPFESIKFDIVEID